MKPLFTVIVLVYNNSQYLETCLDSVFRQNYENMELLVVDDGSKTFDIPYFEAYISQHKRENIRFASVYANPENFGTVKSANGALTKANGEYIKLIAADDAFYDENVLSNAQAGLEKCRDGLVISKVMKCDAELQPIGEYKTILQPLVNDITPKQCFQKLSVHNGIIAGGAFFRKDFFEVYGLFDESYRLLEDWPTWLRVTRDGCKILYMPFFSVNYRANGGIGTSTNTVYMEDKNKVLRQIIIPAKKELGLFTYCKARLSFALINAGFVRKLYGLVFRKN